MTAHDALLRAVIESPDDDTPRLVYADWLEENGQPERAEFIRVQVEQAAVVRDGTDPALAGRLERRAGELERVHQTGWLQELGIHKARGAEFFFARGFLDEVWCSVKYFADHAAGWFDAAPVRVVALRRPSGTNLAGLVRVPHFARVRVLKLFRTEWRDDLAAALLDRLTLTQLRGLIVTEYMVDQTRTDWHDRFAGVAAHIARTPDFADLGELDLGACGVGDAGGRAIAESRYLRRLKRLILRWNPMSEPVLALLRARFGDRLEV